MCLSYLSVLSPFLFSCKNVFLSVCVCVCVWGGGGGLTSGTYFFDLLLLFLKNALLSFLFHSKMSFMRKNPDFFPCSLRFNKLTNDFFQGAAAKHHFFSFSPKGSLFSLYYCHSYYPAYLVWNLFFYTNNPYFFTPFPSFLSLLFPYFLLKGT